MSAAEILTVIRTARDLGFDKIRFTGGEPLMRDGIVGLVGACCRLSGIRDVGLTTNALLLPTYAVPLREAGLKRLNISLDTLRPERFREISPGADLSLVVRGIDAAVAARFELIKLNCVIESSADEPDAVDVAEFARRHGMEVRFIRRMNLPGGEFWPVIGGEGGHCSRCNRLRVTCDGRVIPCLANDLAFSIREHGPEQALRLALQHKPAAGTHSQHRFQDVGG